MTRCDELFDEYVSSNKNILIIRDARIALECDNFNRAENLLKDLLEECDVVAIYIHSSFSRKEESIENYEARHINEIKYTAHSGFPPGIHKLAVYYDVGEYVVTDKNSASILFEKAAIKGHPHSMWIHGEDLLYGRNNIKKDEKLGVKYIRASADLNFEYAINTLIDFHINEKFGFNKDYLIIEKYKNILGSKELLLE